MPELLDEAWSRDIFCRCLPFILPTEISVDIVQRVLKYLLPISQAPTTSPSVIYLWKYRQNKSVGKVLVGKKKLARSPVGVWVFFPTEVATEMGIADDQYSDRHIPSVMPSVKMLPTNCVFYTDRMHPSVKLFNGVVSNHKIKPDKFSLP